MRSIFIFNLWSIFILLLSSSCHYFATDYDQMLESLYSNSVPFISSDSLRQLHQNESNFSLFDTRAKKEYQVSHIQHAIYIGYNDFDLKQLASVPKDQPIILYCSVGYRSERIGEQLQKAGFTEVYNLYGGIFQWINEGHPIFNHKKEPTDSIHAYSKSWGKWLKKGIKVYD